MSFLAPLAPVAGMALGGLLGGAGKGSPQVNYTPPGFNAGGLNATFGGSGYNVTPSADRMAAVGGVASTFGQQANELGALRPMVAPGFSALRQSQLSTLQNQRSSALGNLRDNLARRRILGSSFAQDSLARADQEYQKTQSDVIAQTYLQEIAASQQLIQQQYTAARGQFQTGLDEMNLEADIAAKLTGSASSALEKAASTQAELDAKSAAGAGSFWGSIGQKAGSGIGSFFSGGAGGIGSFFGGGGAAGAGAAGDAMSMAMAL